MKGSLKRNGAFITLIAVVIVLCAALLGITVAQRAVAAEEFTALDTITVGHITDTHYYPFRFCYTGEPIATADSNYFYNYIMAKSTKMWLEGEMAYDAGLANFAIHSPDYIVLSGDCGQDGELVSHIDMANKLRKLQNYIRGKGKTNFQIFVVPGNHDLYNPDSFRFDKTGMKQTYYYTSRMDFVQIYAGLGYPNMTEAEAAFFYDGLTEELPTGYEYVRSNLSHDFKYMWQFTTDGDAGADRVFDPDVVGDDELTIAKFLADDIIDLIDNTDNFVNAVREGNGTSMCYGYDVHGDARDIDKGQLTTIGARKDGNFSVLGLDVIISNAEGGHILGGWLQNETQDMLKKNKAFFNPTHADGSETLVIATAHHSLLPHWDMEEEITTGFIMYNWTEVSDLLADLGVRYAYTGHQHANDAVSGISFKGNQMIDMESSANISVGSQVKLTTIERGTYGAGYAEKAYLAAYQSEVIKADDADRAAYGDYRYNKAAGELFTKIYPDDKYGYIARNKIGVYIDQTNKTVLNYSAYAEQRIYRNVVENVVSTFLRKDITEKLGDLVSGISVGPFNLGNYSQSIINLANNLIQGINTEILADYTYGGSNPDFAAADMKVFGFLEEMVFEVLYTNVPEGNTVCIFDVFMDAYMRHSTGDNYDTLDQMPESHRKALNELLNGNFIDMLFNKLLDRKTGLMRLIVGLNDTTFDLSENVTGLDSIFGLLLGDRQLLTHFNLGSFIKTDVMLGVIDKLVANLGMEIDLHNNTLPEVIDDIVAKYLTDNFKQGLGEYAYNIMVAFACDGERIDVKTNSENDGKGVLLTVAGRESDITYISKERAEIISVENGKLPSMITTNFGTDPATTENFTYFTDRRVTDGAIQYTTDVQGHTQVVTKAATTEIYGTTKPLIDLGIWCQSGYVELSRHTVKLTGLTAGTTYAYRVGSQVNNYWSDWFTFTTAPASGTFEALIVSDLQASTQTSYQRIDKIYRDVLQNEFNNNVSFILNPGDVVDNGRNLSQFKWWLNSSPDIYAGHAMVTAAGNHDNKWFTVEKASNVDEYGGRSENAMAENYNYLMTHFNYELSDAQKQQGGFYYSFDYGDVHFTVLNTNDVEKKNSTDLLYLGEDQYEWLVADLSNTTKSYKVVMMHKSLYSEGSHSYDKDVVGMREQLTPLFADKGVNLVIAGHDHVYNETFYLDKDGNKVKTNANGKNEISKNSGTLYVTMGTMGEKFYNWVENDKVLTNVGTELHTQNSHLSDPTFGKLVFDGKKLYYYGYQYLRNESKIVAVKSTGLSGGAIAGIVIACAVVVAAVVVAVILVIKKKAKGGKPAPVAEVTAPVEPETPVAEPAAEEPVEETPVEEPAEEPVEEEAPIEEAPAEEAPAEDAPVEEPVEEEAPVEETPAEGTEE